MAAADNESGLELRLFGASVAEWQALARLRQVTRAIAVSERAAMHLTQSPEARHGQRAREANFDAALPDSLGSVCRT